MASTSGRAGLLQVSVTAGGAGTYTTVTGINSVTIDIDGNNIDVTELPATFIARIQGLKEVKVNASGFYNGSDTNGQVAIRSALLNDTVLWLKVMPDGSTGYKLKAVVDKFATGAPVAGAIPLTLQFSVDGSGAVSTF